MKKPTLLILISIILLISFTLPTVAEDISYSPPPPEGLLIEMENFDDFTDFVYGSKLKKKTVIKKTCKDSGRNFFADKAEDMIDFADQIGKGFYYLECSTPLTLRGASIKCDFYVNRISFDYYSFDYDTYKLNVWYTPVESTIALKNKFEYYRSDSSAEPGIVKLIEITLSDTTYEALLYNNDSPYIVFFYHGLVMEIYFNQTDFTEDNIDSYLSNIEIKHYAPPKSQLGLLNIAIVFSVTLVVATIIIILFKKRNSQQNQNNPKPPQKLSEQ